MTICSSMNKCQLHVCSEDEIITSKNKRLNEWMTAGLLCSKCRKNELSLKVNKSLLVYYNT